MAAESYFTEVMQEALPVMEQYTIDCDYLVYLKCKLNFKEYFWGCTQLHFMQLFCAEARIFKDSINFVIIDKNKKRTPSIAAQNWPKTFFFSIANWPKNSPNHIFCSI